MATKEGLSWERDVGVIRIPLLGIRGEGKYALVDGDYDGEYLSGFRWVVSPIGYVTTTEWVDGKNKTIYLHRLVQPSFGGLWVDHINRDKLDNRSCNLRLVNQRESALNRRQAFRRKTLTGYRGVRHHRRDRKRVPGYSVVFKGKYKGSFQSAESAALAYDRIAFAAYGNDAVLNFPTSQTAHGVR